MGLDGERRDQLERFRASPSVDKRQGRQGTQIAPFSVEGRTCAQPFVGRGVELAVLGSTLEGATSVGGSLVLITGEAGIGKTRLMTELGRVASQQDLRIAAGRCWEQGGAPPFWPWIQVIRSLR